MPHPEAAVLRTPQPVRAGRLWCGVRRWLAVVALMLAAMLVLAGAVRAQTARAETMLDLLDRERDIDAWPYARVLIDETGSLDAKAAFERAASFVTPAGPHANLGFRQGAVWLRVPVNVPSTETGRWMLMLDYPSLDRIDVHVISDGLIVRHVRLGDHLPMSERPVRARAHLMPLLLEPGVEHELLLRVETTSSMILPLRLVKQDALFESESRFQLLQGIAVGLGLCLIAYSLAHGMQTRDLGFVYYGLSVCGITLFFLAYHGVGPQQLWGEHEWLTRNLSPLSVMPAVAGGLMFLHEVLEVRSLSRPLSHALRGTAVLSMLAGLAFAVGLIDYRSMHQLATLLGPTPILLGLPAAFVRARRGDRTAMLVFVGWGIYGGGIAMMAAFLRGVVPLNAWTEHAFQASSLAEMFMWLWILGRRANDLRRRAERADRERESLMNLAHTDALTGLPNRRGLQRALETALQAARADRPVAVFLLDLDGFKAVNDRFGHGAGDELLRAVARRLREQLREHDLIARMGGDEFVVLAHELASAADAADLGDKLLQAFADPFEVAGWPCRLGGTIGYALAPQDGTLATDLLARADSAMYRGKHAGKHRLLRDTGLPREAAPA